MVVGNPMAFEVGLAPRSAVLLAGPQHCTARTLTSAAPVMLCVCVHVHMCV